MTMEEFIKKYKNDCRYYFDGYYSDCIDDFLTNIYNDNEAQLKAKDEDLKLAMDLSEHMLDELKTERGIKEYLAKVLKAKDKRIAELGLLKHKLKQSDDKAKKQDEIISNLYKQIEILKREPKKIKRKRA